MFHLTPSSSALLTLFLLVSPSHTLSAPEWLPATTTPTSACERPE